MPKPRHRQSSRPVAKKPAPTATRTGRAAKAAKPGRTVVSAKAPAKRAAPSAARKVAKDARQKPAARKGSVAQAPARRGGHGPSPAVVAKTAVPLGPASHDLAVEAFERGFQALQQRQFGRAGQHLASVLNDFPDEKELQERARVYLNICTRQQAAHAQNPRSLEERINSATVALNRGEFTEGLSLLRKLEADHGDHDLVQYMLCVAYTVLGDAPHALEHLKRAVALNRENKFLASQDADLDPLRRDPGFAAALETAIRPSKAVAKRR